MRTLINIDVSDLDAAVNFYSTALDLKCSRIIDGDVAEMVGASSIIYLLRKNVGTQCFKKGLTVRKYERHWTPVHVDFVVENIELAKQKVIQAGAVCDGDLVEWLGSKCITFSDPFGHGFCLIEFSDYTYKNHT